MKRKILSRSAGLATRQRVYQIQDGLEVDEIDHYEVRRSRVFYDDIILMTFHRHRGRGLLIFTGIMVIIAASVAILVGLEAPDAAWILFAFMGGPFLIVFLFRVVFAINEVNVYGRRSQARLRFLRLKRARRIFDELVSTTRSRQSGRTAATREKLNPSLLDQGIQ